MNNCEKLKSILQLGIESPTDVVILGIRELCEDISHHNYFYYYYQTSSHVPRSSITNSII